MNVTIEDLSPCRKKLTIHIPAEDVDKEYQKVIQDLRKKVTIPGFRKGKASLSTIKRRFKREISTEVKEKLLEHSLKDALVENKISPVTNPDMDVKSINVAENQPVEYDAEVEFIPSIEVADYKGVEISKPAIGEISEDHINQALQVSQRENAINEPLDDDDHLIVDKDSVTIHHQRTLDGEPFKEPVENYTFWLGVDPIIPELSQNVFGKQKGDHVDFSVEYPENHEDKGCAGKTIQFAVDIVNVEKVVLPEIDDEFAKDLEAESLDELKQRIKNNIAAHLEHEVLTATKTRLIRKIAEPYDFEVPPGLIKDQKKRYPDKEEEEIIKMLRAGIVLTKIQEQENIEVTDEEVDAVVTQLAAQKQVTVADMKTFLEKQGGLNQIRSDIAETKTLDFLYEHANVAEE